MRIITGRFKGRHLCSFSADFIRPMTDRVKTVVFDTLYSAGLNFVDSRVLDLFSGTGNLALEALSRGAKEAYLVDSSKKSIQIIRKNCQLLDVHSNIRIYHKDVFHFLDSYKGDSFELVFADPPFKKKLGKKTLDKLSLSKVGRVSTFLVLETSVQEEFLEKAGSYQLFTKKKFGDKQVLFYRFIKKQSEK